MFETIFAVVVGTLFGVGLAVIAYDQMLGRRW
jgi:hypothetical protein